MADIFEQLKMKIIIDARDLQLLKTYIADKYPDAASRRKALILSDAIHQIMDHQLQPFGVDNRVQIKKRLFERLQPDTQFKINAYHVFEACSLLESQTEEFWDSLGRWAAMHQDQAPERKVLQDMVLQIRSILATPLQIPEVLIREIPAEINEYTTRKEISDAEGKLNNSFSRRWVLAAAAAAAVICCLLVAAPWKQPQPNTPYLSESAYLPTGALEQAVIQLGFMEAERMQTAHLSQVKPKMPMALRYRAIDQDALRRYLESKDSMLAETPYFDNILQVAERFDIHPLLIFAITGQEQGFVPKSHPKAQKIANNPYNVFGSWETYNTDITDASEIAARTLVNLSQDCPEGTDIFQWINRKYAEDPNWHVGVSQIFKKLVVIAGE